MQKGFTTTWKITIHYIIGGNASTFVVIPVVDHSTLFMTKEKEKVIIIYSAN